MRHLTKLETQEFYEAMTTEIERIRKAPREALEIYIRDSEQVAEGRFDMALIKSGELEKVKKNRRNVIFYRTLAQAFIQIQDLTNKYLEESKTNAINFLE